MSNPLAAVCNVGAYMHSTNLLVATSLRNVLGTKVTNHVFFYGEIVKRLGSRKLVGRRGIEKHGTWGLAMISMGEDSADPSKQCAALPPSLSIQRRTSFVSAD